MATKRKGKRSGKGRQNKNTQMLLLEAKAKKFLQAEKAYWEQRQSLSRRQKDLNEKLSLEADASLPLELSSTVWGLKDGVAFVRHVPIGGKVGVSFKVIPWSLQEWAQDGPILPLKEGELFLGKSGFGVGLSNSILINCQINNIKIPYGEFSSLKYGDVGNSPTIERAFLDFQLTLLGIKAGNISGSSIQQVTSKTTLGYLEGIASEFEGLLERAVDEEQLQQYIKKYPFVLHPTAKAIPKQKLGDDFVTDFVLVATTAQGPTYFMVELERSSHNVLTKDFILAGPVNHAIKQTQDWEIWLETNKAYIQNKLPGFETPNYIVVIVRGNHFDEKQKSYLRTYNRMWKSLKLLTYDDVLVCFRNLIARLKEISDPNEKTK